MSTNQTLCICGGKSNKATFFNLLIKNFPMLLSSLTVFKSLVSTWKRIIMKPNPFSVNGSVNRKLTSKSMLELFGSKRLEVVCRIALIRRWVGWKAKGD